MTNAPSALAAPAHDERGTSRLAGPGSQRYLRSLRRPRAAVGLGLVATIAGAAVLAPLLFPEGYDAQSRDALLGPSLTRPFGTDEVGRSVFVRAIYGVRADLSLVLLAVPIGAVVGTLLGLLGAVHSAAGNAAQRLLDVVTGFPSLILGISVALVLDPGWWALLVALTIYTAPPFGRLARATFLAQQHRDYVLAARMLGVGNRQILSRHMLPFTIATALTQCVAAVVAAIFLESSLSLVGLGIQPPQPSLGVLLNRGARYVEFQKFYVLGPALVLLLLVVGFMLIADELNEGRRRT
jgi:peptide/nickel transport system permease protein